MPLLPRYRRPMTFGAVLDETFRVFRRTWLSMLVVLAISAVPSAALSLLIGRSALRSLSPFLGLGSPGSPGSPGDPSAVSADNVDVFTQAYGSFWGYTLLIGLFSVLLLLPAFAAVTLLADGELRGHRPPVLRAYVQGLRLLPRLLVAGVLSWLGLVLMTLLAIPLFVLTLFGVLGGLIALVALLVWWGNPRARRPWLKWLIILTVPFGLPTYFAFRWTLLVPLVVLERTGPRSSLRRSMELSRGHWFRIAGTTFVLGLVASMLQGIPSWIGGIVVAAVGFGVFSGADPTWLLALANVVNVASVSLGQILFGALPFIGLTLLMEDLRNRREGADLAERLAQLTSRTPMNPGAPPSPASLPS